MYRVLLADDEIHVCQLVQHLVDWNALQLELIGVADSGVEAFEQIISKKPDIVISDIRMSGYSGIDLLEKTRALGLGCRFVLISGYRQFEYAQKAIQLGVTDYVVKPLKKQELENALRKAIAELLDAPDAPVLPSPYVPSMQGSRHGREELVASLQSGALSLEQLTPDSLREVYGIGLEGVCFAVSWKFLCYGEYSEEVLRLLENKAAAYLQIQGQSWFREHVLLWQEGNLHLLCAVDTAADMMGWDLLLESCGAVISIFHGWQTALGFSRLCAGESLSAPLQRADDAVESHLLSPHTMIHNGDSEQRTLHDYHSVVEYESCSRLIAAMQILDTNTVRSEVERALQLLAQNPGSTVEAVRGYIAWVIGNMNHALSAFENENAEASRYINRAALLQELKHTPSVRQFGQRLLQVLTGCMETTREAVRNAENRPVRQAKLIVAERYMEQISLQDVADAVGLNSVYLSVLFKKETGTNFKDYVTNIRIETAKKFLRDGENMVDVAEKVGYKDAKYFSKLFTRMVGVKPTEYKKLYH